MSLLKKTKIAEVPQRSAFLSKVMTHYIYSKGSGEVKLKLSIQMLRISDPRTSAVNVQPILYILYR